VSKRKKNWINSTNLLKNIPVGAIVIDKVGALVTPVAKSEE